MKKITYIMLLATASLLLASCGGGGSGFVMPIQPVQPKPKPNPTFDPPQWSNEMAQIQQTSDYEHTMTLCVALPESLLATVDANDQLAVFCGETLRGIATREALADGVYVWMGMVYGADGEQLTFKYYSASTRHMHLSASSFSFKADTHYGTLDHPHVLELNMVTAE